MWLLLVASSSGQLVVFVVFFICFVDPLQTRQLVAFGLGWRRYRYSVVVGFGWWASIAFESRFSLGVLVFQTFFHQVSL